MGTKYKKENKKNTIVYTKRVEVTVHYIKLTGYDIVNDT